MSIHLEVIHGDRLDPRVKAEIVALCEAAYNEDFSTAFEEFTDPVHVIARDARGALVSHAMWVARGLQPDGHHPLRTAYVEAVATAPNHQRRGIGTAGVERVVVSVAEDPVWELVALSPAVPEFYARRGWESWLGPLAIRRDGRIEPSPSDELVMFRRLPRTPRTIDAATLLTAEWRSGELW